MNILPTSFAQALLVAGLCAQTPPCHSLNDANNNVTNAITLANLGGPWEHAYRVKAPKAMSVQALRVYTGNQFSDAFMKLALYKDNGGVPGQKLGEGTWKNAKPTPLDWRGANLDEPVPVALNEDIWVVFTEPGFSTPPFDPASANTVTYVLRVAGQAAWNPQSPRALKVRFFCDLLDTQGTATAGTACRGSASGVGTVFNSSPPSVGNQDFRIEGTGLPPGATAFLALGVVANFPSIPLGPLAPGCAINTDIVAVIAGATGTGDVRSTNGAFGHVSFGLPIPNNPAVKGVYVGAQIAAADRGSRNTLPLVFSNGLRVTVF